MTFFSRLRNHVRHRRHTSLLAAIVAAFAVRPLVGDTGAAPIVFSVAILALALIALYTIQIDELVGEHSALVVQRKRRNRVGWLLVLMALAERLLVLFRPSPWLLLLSSLWWLVFIAFVTGNQLRSLLMQKAVTGETLSMAVSVYLLLGFSWGILYAVIYQLQPQAFGFNAPPGTAVAMNTQQHLFPIFAYFSLTTLATIGFGDIVPLTLQARYAAVAEGITGQLYLAILVARLVGLHMSGSEHPHTGSGQ